MPPPSPAELRAIEAQAQGLGGRAGYADRLAMLAQPQRGASRQRLRCCKARIATQPRFREAVHRGRDLRGLR
jgi:hypothetical protein